ncbi:reverse transcriptase domain-containing protein [Nonomuraea solani]|uniref:reverse transcriptase domain-containing protein n=1 Tax=Nonomuraea solani TaxID=1144553 RepID=UPI00190ECF40|nr:reverse transcriptase domain-containing protein [Nonomuraea solani]
MRAVEIPKTSPGGGVRILGLPTVADRIAQTVVARHLMERVEPIFHEDSFGYRPGRSVLDAVERCWKRDRVIDLDVPSAPTTSSPKGISCAATACSGSGASTPPIPSLRANLEELAGLPPALVVTAEADHNFVMLNACAAPTSPKGPSARPSTSCPPR